MTSHSSPDVAIVGCGPSALLLAHALTSKGCRVVAIAPQNENRVRPVYGSFEDDVVGTLLDDGVVARFSKPLVRFTDDDVRTLPLNYVRIDGEKLEKSLCRKLGSSFSIVDDRVQRVSVQGDAVHVSCEQTGTHIARFVVDASGLNSTLTVRESGAPTAFQAAFGKRVRAADAPHLMPGEMMFMDWSSIAGADPSTPTFLYAMSEQTGEVQAGEVFVEETSLAARPPLTFSRLSERLSQRIASQTSASTGLSTGSPTATSSSSLHSHRDGVDSARSASSDERDDVERCMIPLNAPLPRRENDVIPFGAALGLVHPATGYQLGTAARLAPLVASLIVTARAHGDHPKAAARRVVDGVWTRDRRRVRALHLAGLETLLKLDADGLIRFFRRFFDAPLATWRPFLSGTPSSTALAVSMAKLFVRADAQSKRAMVAGVVERGQR